MDAGRSPLALDPANKYFFWPKATQRMAFAAMLLSTSNRSSVMNRKSLSRRLPVLTNMRLLTRYSLHG